MKSPHYIRRRPPISRVAGVLSMARNHHPASAATCSSARSPISFRKRPSAALNHRPADASARRPIQIAPAFVLKPGSVLLRDWHGTQHQVIVRENGVEFRGKQYKSLSQVAHRITGTRWSGPLFFGVKGDRQEQADGSL